MTRIWDLLIRIYHWLQALLAATLLATGFAGGGSSLLHQGAGAVLLLMLIWRLIWGFTGSETARFSRFVPSPQRLLLYLRGRAVEYCGHNPAGAVMVVAMLCLLLLQVVTGGLLSELVDATALLGRKVVKNAEVLHAMNARLLTGMISLHICAVLCYGLRGRPILRAMITGNTIDAELQPRLASNSRALLALLVSLALVLGLLNGVIFLDI